MDLQTLFFQRVYLQSYKYLVQHYYTVGYVSDANYQPLLAIILKGHCLEQAGFETGTPLEVRVLYCRTA